MGKNRSSLKLYTLISFVINLISCLIYKSVKFSIQYRMDSYQIFLCILVYVVWISIYIYLEYLFDRILQNMGKYGVISIISILNISIFNFSLLLFLNKFVELKNSGTWIMKDAKIITSVLIIGIIIFSIKEILYHRFSMRFLIIELVFVYFIFDFKYLDYLIFLIVILFNKMNIKSHVNERIIGILILIALIFCIKNKILLLIIVLMISELLFLKLLGGKNNAKIL